MSSQNNKITVKTWDADKNGVTHALFYDSSEARYGLSAEKNGVQETLMAIRFIDPPGRREDGSISIPMSAIYFAEQNTPALTEALLLKNGFDFPGLQPESLLDNIKDWQDMHCGEADTEVLYSARHNICRVIVFNENGIACKRFELDHDRVPLDGLEPLDERKALDLADALRNLLRQREESPQEQPQAKLTL